MPTERVEVRRAGVEDLWVESGGVAPVIRGYAIVFNQLSENLGAFKERIQPGAVDRTLRAGTDLRALVNHDPSQILGRLSAGTLRVKKDPHGLLVEINPPRTTAGQNIVESIRRRDVTGFSFAFCVLPDWATWRDIDPDGVPIRDINDMSVREISVVAFPAYTQTEVTLGSLHAHSASHDRGRPVTVSERLR